MVGEGEVDGRTFKELAAVDLTGCDLEGYDVALDARENQSIAPRVSCEGM